MIKDAEKVTLPVERRDDPADAASVELRPMFADPPMFRLALTRHGVREDCFSREELTALAGLLKEWTQS